MWMYHEELGYWMEDAKEYIKSYVAKIPELTSRSAYGDLCMVIQGDTYCNIKSFQENEGFINCKNFAVNILTGEPVKHNKDYNFKNRLEIDYDPDAKCPEFLWLLTNAISDKKDIDFIQEFFGYAVSPLLTKMILILQGKGDSGKTTFARILILLLGGTNNISSASVEELCNRESRAIAYLDDRKANICAEMNDKFIKNVGPIKQATGGDSIDSDKKNKDRYSYLNRAKLMFVCNNFPILADNVKRDVAWWNRVGIIKFYKPLDIPENKRVSGLEEALEKYYKPELAGILNWALQGIRRYIANKYRFSYDFSESMNTWYVDEENKSPLSEFIDGVFIQDEESNTPKEIVRVLYRTYCENNPDHEPLTAQEFASAMDDLGFKISRPIKGKESAGSSRVYVYKGLRLANASGLGKKSDKEDTLPKLIKREFSGFTTQPNSNEVTKIREKIMKELDVPSTEFMMLNEKFGIMVRMYFECMGWNYDSVKSSMGIFNL